MHVFKLRDTRRVLLFLTSIIASTGCQTSRKDSSELILRGSVAESSEIVSLDPVFLARQKKTEELLFGSDEMIVTESGRVPFEVDPSILDDAEPELTAPGKMPPEPQVIPGFKLFAGSGIVWPVKGDISSAFGMRHKRFHAGIDIRAPKGAPVYAAAAGQVLTAKRRGAYGNVIVIGHDNDHQTLYAHLSILRVREGDLIKMGQVIGAVGRTGRATGNHLHFETRVAGGIPQNPLAFLPRERTTVSLADY